MTIYHKFKSILQSGENMHGCWLGTYSPVVTQIIAQAGYHVGIIDLEHGPGSYQDAQSIMPSMAMADCISAIRIPFAHEAHVKKAMDLGPSGIMVPNIRSAHEAQYMVNATRYAPQGIRGAAPRIVRATGYGKYITEYEEFLETEFLLMGQIESKEAVDCVKDIAAVDGLDMLFIGPADLSASLGEMRNFTSDEYLSAIDKIEQAAKQSGKLLGTVPWPGRSISDFYQSGYHLIVSGTDTILLKDAAEQDVNFMDDARK